MRLFRERLLGGLLDKRAVSQELVKKLLAWRHPGFSVHVGDSVAADDKQRLQDTAAYLVRNPLSLKKLVYLDGQRAVVYRSRMNPVLGRNFIEVKWVALSALSENNTPLLARIPTGYPMRRAKPVTRLGE